MTDTLPVEPAAPEPEPVETGMVIPPFEDGVYFVEAVWTDPYRRAVEATRSDRVVEIIPANIADWRWRVINEGYPERGILPLRIREPGIDAFKAEAIDEIMKKAEELCEAEPLIVYGRFEFPGDTRFLQYLAGLQIRIAAFRANRKPFEHRYSAKDLRTGQPHLVSLVEDDIVQKHTIISDMAAVLETRRMKMAECAHRHVALVDQCRNAGEVEAVIHAFMSEADSVLDALAGTG